MLAVPCGVPGSGSSGLGASACRSGNDGSAAAPSTASIGMPPPGSGRCNNVPWPAWAGRPAHNPSVNKAGFADGEPDADTSWLLQSPVRLDFGEKWRNLYQGPWEWPLPEAQASKGICPPSGHSRYRDRTSLTLPQNSGRIWGWVKSGEQGPSFLGERLIRPRYAQAIDCGTGPAVPKARTKLALRLVRDFGPTVRE